VELGSGLVTCAHGVLPVPAPATVELLKNVPVSVGGQPFEATTPTGAAILRTVTQEWRDDVLMRPQRIGYGIGWREGIRPNVLRLYLGDDCLMATDDDCDTQEAIMVECNVDDMTPEETACVLDLLLAFPVYDVFLTPIIMKKSRPAVKISVLCAPEERGRVEEVLFYHSSTFGLRFWPVTKRALSREVEVQETPYGPISVKRGRYRGQVIKAKGEYEECRKLAEDHNVPLTRVREALLRHDPPRTP